MNHFFSGLLVAALALISIPALGRVAGEHARASAAAAAPSGCLTDTTQADFASGVPTNVDLVSSPGNAILLAASALDQQNTTVGVVGQGFSSTVWFGQTFTPAASGILAEVDLDIFCASCTGTTPDITVSIRTVGPFGPVGNDLASATIPGFSSGTPTYRSAVFSPAPQLTGGTAYAIVARSNTDPSPGNYTYAVSGTNNPYPGGHSVRSTNSGVSWSSQTSDIGFKTFMRTTYAASGDLVSSTKDGSPTMAVSPNWTTLSWQATTPANTSLRFQLAGSNSIGGPFNFVGPDGTAATYYTTSNASLLQFSGNRYLQYRAYLGTTDNTVTPALQSVKLCYIEGMPADIAIGNDDGVATPAPGTSIVYAITASNSGPGDAAGVAIADSFPAPLSCTWTCDDSGGGTCTASGAGDINDVIDLPDNASVTYSATCSIPSASTGSVSNTATATFAGDANLSNNSATDADTLAPQADLFTTNTDGVTTATPGGTVGYTITVANAGPSDAPGSTVTDVFPPSLSCTWTCGGADGGSCTASGSGNINDAGANLPNGASVAYAVTCSISAAATGSLGDTASAATAAGVTDPNPGNDSAIDTDTLSVQANLVVTLTDNRSVVQIGDVLDYAIDVTNPTGPSDAVATVTDVLPAQLSGGVWTCTPSGGATCAPGDGATLSDTATLPVGGRASYLFSAIVQDEGVDGTIVDMASADLNSGTDPTPANNSATDTDMIAIFADGFEEPAPP